jgi:hypothetical protein
MQTTTATAVALSKNSTERPGLLAGEISLRVHPDHGTAVTGESSVENAAKSYRRSDFEVVLPVPVPSHSASAVFDSKPIQIWEGVVLALDPKRRSIDVRLKAKLSNLPDHNASIGLEWVHDQDRALARPGAIFYLTVFRKLSHGSVQNAQEIRFRRLPNWSRADVQRVRTAADHLAAKMVVTDAGQPD